MRCTARAGAARQALALAASTITTVVAVSCNPATFARDAARLIAGEFRLEQVQVPMDSPLAGQTLSSARLHDHTGTLVLAMREPGGAFRTWRTNRIRPNDPESMSSHAN